MDKLEILKSLDKKSNGEIYLGVVGAVRSGKSTFIKKCIELLVLPNINDEETKKRCIDEIPQSSSGKIIMTIEPKFVPSSGAVINLDGLTTNIKFVDCVGFVTPESSGYEDEMGNPRMVKTPWSNDELPFIEAASIGTEKVIKDHATIGIVITSDGTINGMSRTNYIDAEEKVINELKNIGKPFIVIVNSKNPTSFETKEITTTLKNKYDIPVLALSIEDMRENDVINILKEALYEFPINHVSFNIPDWVGVLPLMHPLKQKFLEKMKESTKNLDKLRDAELINIDLENNDEITSSYISGIDTINNEVNITLEANEEIYNNLLTESLGENIKSKGELLKMFLDYKDSRGEFDSIKNALKEVSQTGYGIILPSTKDMKLEHPEIIKQGNKFGIKLKAKASSIHLIKVDVENSFEPIIGSEMQSKELIDHIMKDKNDTEKIWKSEIFGRSLNDIVGESIQAKLSLLPSSSKNKLSQTITKMVNKGSNNLIAIVL